MALRDEVYKCDLCGNIVEVVHGSAGGLACCGQSMNLLNENTTDAATEKHVPVIEKIAGGYKITVGEVAHPMQEEHYIEWIELIAGDTVLRQYLNPGDEPVAFFKTDATDIVAREYCNLHGLWKS
ncbi:MAG: desulfoferrodoxin [Gammaproteobacteria bacterium]|nr:MAG: desulfoferrodoxin [Gammaproteobacteria bacterium]